jgi:hypothetical protein
LTHVLVQQHPDQERERVATEQLVGRGSWAMVRLGTRAVCRTGSAIRPNTGAAAPALANVG